MAENTERTGGEDMIDEGHPILPGEPGTAAINFTKERFTGDSYLWRNGDEVWISFIESKEPGKGYFSELVAAMEAHDFNVLVPTPLGKMTAILTHLGFIPQARDIHGESVEVWERPTP